MTPKEKVGLVCYLRSIAPSSLSARSTSRGQGGRAPAPGEAADMTGGSGNGGAGGAAVVMNVACGANVCSTMSNPSLSMFSGQLARGVLR